MLDWSACDAVERDPSRVSGAWVFKGTRVPVAALFENLEDGASLDQFLEWFPGRARRSRVRAHPAKPHRGLSGVTAVRILFDQGTPVPLRRALLHNHEISTVFELGWSTLANGELLTVAESRFDLLITTDRNLKHQQRLSDRALAILVLPTTSWPRIAPHVDAIAREIASMKPGQSPGAGVANRRMTREDLLGQRRSGSGLATVLS